MTRRDQMIKWLVYTLGLLPVWVLDAYILNRFPLRGVSPTLLPLAVVAAAVLEGAFAGAAFGLGVGLLWALGYPGMGGSAVLLLVLVGLISGSVTQYMLTQSFFGCLICSVGALAAQEAARLLWALFIQLAPLTVLLEVALYEFLWTLAWTPLVYLIFRLVFRKVGLNRLA
ncbi:MAG: rod shape-determining protein MreD [Lawsonibacter sp.]|nr:rod shape-determining protein MreD [Lawsonibacter sp.]